MVWTEVFKLLDREWPMGELRADFQFENKTWSHQC